jgi:preprotein translocase subunit SecY
MPKKTRRQVSKSGAFMPAQRVTEFNPDYTYIRRDLTRIATLAGGFFVVLVVLSFFLR